MSHQDAVDPVCRKRVPIQGAITRRRDGKTYYFCSEMCASRFDAESAASHLGLDGLFRWPK
jgi:YHS domain-containing protein